MAVVTPNGATLIEKKKYFIFQKKKLYNYVLDSMKYILFLGQLLIIKYERFITSYVGSKLGPKSYRTLNNIT